MPLITNVHLISFDNIKKELLNHSQYIKIFQNDYSASQWLTIWRISNASNCTKGTYMCTSIVWYLLALDYFSMLYLTTTGITVWSSDGTMNLVLLHHKMVGTGNFIKTSTTYKHIQVKFSSVFQGVSIVIVHLVSIFQIFQVLLLFCRIICKIVFSFEVIFHALLQLVGKMTFMDLLN